MGKYIIEVGDAYAEYVCGKGDMLCLPVRINEFEDNWLNTDIPLTPYTEPDMETIRKEAYQKGYEDATVKISSNEQAIAEKAYQRGLNDAWTAARKIANMPYDEEEKAFGSGGWAFVEKHTAAEAIEKIRQYEQEQEEEQIQVGDEVRNVKSGWTAVVTRISDDNCLTLMDGNGAIADGYEITRFTKTGRHFPKLVALQEEMRLR